MRNHLIAALLSVAAASPMVLPSEALAQRHNDRHDRSDRHGGNDRRWQGDRNDRNWDPAGSYKSGNYRERRLGRNDRIYRGKDGRAYCKRNDGTTGLVIGALGGGVLANLIGGGTLGTLAGAGGGALLGRSVDRGNIKCRSIQLNVGTISGGEELAARDQLMNADCSDRIQWTIIAYAVASR